MNSKRIIFFLVYLIFGAYLINSVFEFYPIPEIVSNFDKWLIAVGGVMIIIGGFNFLKNPKESINFI